ncbi:glycosyltransferase 87 family protein [Miltoncostaea marina]|uniref:glycosyltransferase 87 family protein n=1 Tax=Miltoncostaea marina TaxID=2843215 RepID=UPI001C3D6A93|nr:glycosyltransferase 87 family protein [Miltoncostaea marina]
MPGRRRALVAAIAATLALGLHGAAPGAAAPVGEPTPSEATGAAHDLVRAVAGKAGEIQGALRAPARPREPTLTDDEVTAIAETSQQLREWTSGREISRTAVEFDEDTGVHTYFAVSEDAEGDETVEAQVLVSDERGEITEVRTGPQVAWMMARGYDGAFGRAINRPAVWLTLCALFLLPLLPYLRPRRLLSMRTLDLLALLSFGVSLIWFNRGEVFTSVPLQYPPMLYLGARLAGIAVGRARAARPAAGPQPPGEPPPRRRPALGASAPTWLLVSLLAVTLALRFGLNAFDSNVIDVGYAGVIGADRIADGSTPYGNMPDDCGSCDTYGPLTYAAYVPFELARPWSGEWDSLPAAHGAATTFDILCIAGMLVLGWRVAGLRLGVGLALAWAAFPFTGYALSTNANDALVPAMLIWGLVLARHPLGRGLMLGLAIASKFAPAILLGLWSRRPFPRPARRRELLPYAGGLLLAAGLTGWVLLLDGADGLRAFWSRTLGYQLGRDSPFSIWGQFTGLRPLQIGLMVAVGIAAVAVLRWPRRLDLVTVSALSGALLIGIELTLTHWFYLYIPWFLPFALIAMVPEWPPPARPPRPEPEPEADATPATAPVPVPS